MQAALKDQKENAFKVGKMMDRMFLTFRRNRLQGRQPRPYNSYQKKIERTDRIMSPYESLKLPVGPSGPSGPGGRSRVMTIADLPEERFQGTGDFSRYKSSSEEDNDSDYDRNDDSGGRRKQPVRRSGRRLGEGTGTNSSSASAASRRERLAKRERNRDFLEVDESGELVDTSEDDELDMYGSDEENERDLGRGARKRIPRKMTTKEAPRPRKNRPKSSELDLDTESHRSSSSVRGVPKPPKHLKYSNNWAVPLGTQIDREWLQTDKQEEQQYCPQVGDQVVYFPQGHSALLSEFPARDRLLPWNSFNDRWPVVHCEVRDIIFEFPPAGELRRCQSVVATITLVIVRVPEKWKLVPFQGNMLVDFAVPRTSRHKGNTEHVFTVSIRNWDDVPDFIVPYYMFARALECQWRPGCVITADYKATEKEMEIDDQPTVQYKGTFFSSFYPLHTSLSIIVCYSIYFNFILLIFSFFFAIFYSFSPFFFCFLKKISLQGRL